MARETFAKAFMTAQLNQQQPIKMETQNKTQTEGEIQQEFPRNIMTFRELKKARRSGFSDTLRNYREDKKRMRYEIAKLKEKIRNLEKPIFRKATKEDYKEYLKEQGSKD